MKKIIFVLAVVVATAITAGAQNKVVLFDTSHGQTSTLFEDYRGFVGQIPNATLSVNDKEITSAVLHQVSALIMLSPPPTATLTPVERKAIVDFVQKGGRLLFFFDEERRTPLEGYGANDIVKPFGMQYGENCPARRNVGAISLIGEIGNTPREVPYSGGRILTGGIPVCIVNDEGVYQHGAYTKLANGGKIIAFGDGMLGLLLGLPKGQGARLSGHTSGDPTLWWGQDSRIFVQEIITWLLK